MPTQLAGETTVSLSFDDGPDPTWTGKVLERLRDADVKATFFMVGSRVVEHPEVARRVLDAGHSVQLHCHQHIRHTEMTEAELRDDTGRALDALARVGARPSLWRPPWGVCSEATNRAAQSNGLLVRRWSIDTHDWRGDPADAMLADAEPRLAAGGSVLMHDGLGPGAQREGCQNTLELIPALVSSARELNIAISPMAESAEPGRSS